MWWPIICFCLCWKYEPIIKCKGSHCWKLISGCPGNQIRFGDSCYDQLPDNSSTITANADDCMEKGGLLWFPETSLELQFISKSFPVSPGEKYHLGYKNFSYNWGISFLDGSHSPGIPFYSRKELNNFLVNYSHGLAINISEKGDFTKTFGPGPFKDLITESDCLLFNPELVDNQAMFKPNRACGMGKGVCKYKLGN